MKKPAIMKRVNSSGGIIFRVSRRIESTIGSVAEVALVAVNSQRKGFSKRTNKKIIWCLPKGIIDKNEDSRATAIREVKEETGLLGDIIDEIGKISYWYFVKSENTQLHKTVHFYLMKYCEGSTDNHDNEVDDAQWFPINEAIEKLTHKGEREILQKAEKMIKQILDANGAS